jgi:hypothetical protein
LTLNIPEHLANELVTANQEFVIELLQRGLRDEKLRALCNGIQKKECPLPLPHRWLDYPHRIYLDMLMHTVYSRPSVRKH